MELIKKITAYQISEIVHESTKTIIFRGIDKESQNKVLIKALNKEYPALGELKKIEHEYSIVKSLSVSGVVHFLTLIDIGHNEAIVMEDNNSISLSRYLSGKRIDIQEYLRIAVELAKIIGDIHNYKIIHKNINPSNILINSDVGAVTLIDFSIAAKFNKEIQAAVNPGRLEGTLAYISPEQTGRMNRSIDYRTDFYSLGVTLYYLFTGKVPFESTDPMEIIHSHIAVPAIPPKDINQAIPQLLSDIIIKLLSKAAEERYQSATGLLFDLEQCISMTKSNMLSGNYVIGKTDISETINIPEKIYGREKEIQLLFQNFNEAASGTTRMVFVTGPAGIGKSFLVNEIQKPLIRKRGFFISGKFDRFKRDIPYSAFIQAFQDLIRQLLTEDETTIEAWKNRILNDIGGNGQMMINILPDLELLIGSQPSSIKLSPVEIQNTVNYILQSFIRTFASENHPLVIFIDDLQWADIASINLLEILLNSGDIQYLFIIGSYRDNEIDSSHPLKLFFEEFYKLNQTRNEIPLKPFNIYDIASLIQDTFSVESNDAHNLAKIVIDKTAGNPFFVKEFLIDLYNKNLIFFNNQWIFDFDRIKEASLTENVISLMIGRISMLPGEIQKIVKICSCIDSMPVRILSDLMEKNQEELIELLKTIINEGMITVYDNSIKFSHDRIQEAAYSMMDNVFRSFHHYKIGKILMSGANEKNLEDSLFTVVQQLNLGSEYIHDPDETIMLSTLNLQAGKKAKQSAAFSSAFQFFQKGISLLPENAWGNHYDLILQLYSESGETGYLIGEHEQADKYFAEIFLKGKTNLDKIKAYEVKIAHYTSLHMVKEALSLGREALGMLGYKIPKKANLLFIISELIKVSVVMKKYKVHDLIDLPEIIDQNKLAVVRLLMACSEPCYLGEPDYLPIIVLKLTYFSIKNGNSIYAAYAYIAYSLILTSALGNIQKGSQFGKLALDVMNKYNAKSLRPKVHFIFCNMINHWTNHLRDNLRYNEEGIKSGFENGDFVFASYSSNHYILQNIFLGIPLERVKSKCVTYYEIIKKFKQSGPIQLFELCYQLVLVLKGETKDRAVIDGAFWSGEAITREWLEKNNFTDLGIFATSKLLLHYIYGEYDKAFEQAREAGKYVEAMLGMILVSEYYYYYSLTLIKKYENEKNKRHLKLIDNHQKKMKKWAFYSPHNFHHKYLLVEAEKARVMGKNSKATNLYREAIDKAQEEGFLQDEAIGSELAGKFYLDLGMEKFATTYFSRAFNCYNLWGAQPKSNELQQKYDAYIKQ